MHCAIGVAIGDAIGARKIFHRVCHIGVGIEQTGRGASVTQPAGGRELDLHQPKISFADGARVAAALALDHASDQVLGNVVRRGMTGDQRIDTAIGIRHCRPLFLCETPVTPQSRRQPESWSG
jgi:hypothetical protein